MATEGEKPKTNGAAGDIKFPLRKPIQANGEEVSEWYFASPRTGGDIEKCGNPVILDVFGGDMLKVTFDEKKMSAMMSNSRRCRRRRSSSFIRRMEHSGVDARPFFHAGHVDELISIATTWPKVTGSIPTWFSAKPISGDPVRASALDGEAIRRRQPTPRVDLTGE